MYAQANAGPSDRAVYGVGLRPLACWGCGFDSHRRAWMSVCCECCVLSGRGLCDELITRPEESYRLWCVVVCDPRTSWMRTPWPTVGGGARGCVPNTKKCISNMFCAVLQNALRELKCWLCGTEGRFFFTFYLGRPVVLCITKYLSIYHQQTKLINW